MAEIRKKREEAPQVGVKSIAPGKSKWALMLGKKKNGAAPAKPEETKPEETKPVETKPVETKPVEPKPVVTKLTEGAAKTEVNVRMVTTTGLGKENASTAESKTVALKEISGPIGEVSISYGLTIGLGRKFEFARIDVSLRVPFGAEGRDKAYEEAREWAQEKIRQEVDSIRQIASNGGESETDSSL